jgi:stigma-specific protein Stig1
MGLVSRTLMAALVGTGTLVSGCALVLGDFRLPPDGSGGSGGAGSSSTGDTTTTGGCSPDEVTCDGACVKLATDPAHCGQCGHACASMEVCMQSACAASCTSGLTRCGSACVDLQSDAQHCGSCTAVCDSVADGVPHCAEAKCTLACNSGFEACNGGCIALDAGPCP